MTVDDGRERGFVLLGVLVLCALVGALALALSRATHEDVSDTRLQLDLLTARLHVDNGLVRAVAAMADPENPLHGRLLVPNAVVELTQDGESVAIAVEAENGKLDLNNAPLALIRAMMAELTDAGRADSMLQALAEARRTDAPVREVSALLSPAERFGPLPRLFSAHFTVLTAAPAPVESLAPPRLQALLRRTGAALAGGSTRPIYTLRARLVRSRLPPLARQMSIAFAQMPATRPEHIWLAHWGRDVQEP